MTLKGRQGNNISMAVTRLQSEALLLRCAWQEVVCTESCEEQGYSHESNAEANLLYGLSPPHTCTGGLGGLAANPMRGVV